MLTNQVRVDLKSIVNRYLLPSLNSYFNEGITFMSTSHKAPIEVKDIESNVYYKNNPEFFLQLKDIVENHQKGYGIKIKANKILTQWINTILPHLSSTFYSNATKCYWIFNNITDFPVCAECGISMINKNVQSLKVGYGKYCSVACMNKNINHINAKNNTCVKKYGDKCNGKKISKTKQSFSKEKQNQIAEKRQKTVFDTYGVMYNLQIPSVKQQIQQTNLKKYGAKYIFSSPIIQTRIKQTNIKTYGVDNPWKSPEIMRKCHQKYVFNGINFDSAPELALYIYLTDNDIQFQYHSTNGIPYIFDNKVYYYYCDFEIHYNNSTYLVEIKGDQFLKEDGTWQNPYDHTLDAMYEAKHQCALQHNVVILYYNDYKQYLEDISKKYGKKFLNQFKKSSKTV